MVRQGSKLSSRGSWGSVIPAHKQNCNIPMPQLLYWMTSPSLSLMSVQDLVKDCSGSDGSSHNDKALSNG